MIAPSYDLRPAALGDVRHLFEEHHAYRSTGGTATYCFALHELGRVVAAFVWQPPAPGAARSVCPDLPAGVLSLSRMVGVPKEERLVRLRNPLRRQMRVLIDRTRWPVLVTYSDEGAGHSGYLYKISGWTPTVRNRALTLTVDGRRVSRYSNGRAVLPPGAVHGETWIQRWEHRAPLEAFHANWVRVPVAGKRWRSGALAFTYARRAPWVT